MNKDNVIEIVTNLVKAEGLPEVMFKSGTPIAGIIANLAMSSKRNPEATEAEAAQQWIEEFYSYDSAMLDSQIDDIVTALVEGVTGSVETIKSIHAIVEDLVTQIDGMVDKGIALNPKLTQLVAEKEIDVSFQEIDYSPLAVFGTTLPASMESFVGVPKNSPKMAYASVTERYVGMKSPGTPVDIIMDAEDKSMLVNKINALDASWGEDDVRSAIDLVISAGRIRGMVSNCRKAVAVKPNYTEDFVEALSIIDMYAKLIPSVQEHLSAAGYDEATDVSNVSAVLAVLETYHYFVAYHREHTFGDTVLFNNDLLNTDMVGKLTSEGMNILDLARHHSVIWGNNVTISTGITLSAMVSAKERVAKLFNEEQASDDFYRKHEVCSLQKRAFVKVASSYFSTEGIDAGLYLQQKADRLIVEEAPLEDLIFNAIVLHKHNVGMVGAIQKLLGKAYTEAIKDNPEVSKDSLDEYTLDAYLEAVVTVIAKKLVA